MACNHSTLTAWQTLQRLDYVDGVICFGHQQPHRNKSSPFFSSSSNNITMMMPRILQHTHTTSSRLFINAYIYFYVYILFIIIWFQKDIVCLVGLCAAAWWVETHGRQLSSSFKSNYTHVYIMMSAIVSPSFYYATFISFSLSLFLLLLCCSALT